MKKIVSIVAMFILVTSIVKGQEATNSNKSYNLPFFNGIEAGDLANVIVSIGDKQSVTVENEDEGEASFEVKDNVLRITPGSMTNFGNVKIIIICTDLTYIKVSGVSKITSANTIKTSGLEIKSSGASKVDLAIEVQSLTTSISGASKITLKGAATIHTADLSGASNLNAKELDVVKMDVKGSGASKANVNVKSELTGKLSGVSTVKYDEKPASVNISGNDIDSIKKNKTSSNPEDTVNVSFLGSEIKVIDGGEDTKITIGNTEIIAGDKGVKINKGDKDKNYKHKFRGHWAGFELGFNGYVNKDFGMEIPSQYEFLTLNDVKSVGVNINIFELNANIINNRFGVVSGAGLQWNNYRFTDNVVLLPDSGKIDGFHNTAIDSYIKSKLVESWVRVPVFLEYQTAKRKGKQFHIAVGGVFGYKLGSHSKQVYYDGSDKVKDKIYNDFYLNPIKLDAEVRIGWGPINLFASYALTPLYKDNKGPELYPYMVGITLAGW